MQRTIADPHTRGGEPANAGSATALNDLIPTRVGVNRANRSPTSKVQRLIPTRVGVNRDWATRVVNRVPRPLIPTRVGVNRAMCMLKQVRNA